MEKKICYKLFQRIEKQVTLPSWFNKACINLVTKPEEAWNEKGIIQVNSFMNKNGKKFQVKYYQTRSSKAPEKQTWVNIRGKN